MGIKLSGMASGLDTDALVKELMSAQSLKKEKIVKKQTKNTWAVDKWKELNTKLYSLYTGTLTKTRAQGSYLTKKVSSSDETKAAITAGASAPKGSHTLQVEQLASAQYLTGGVIKDSSGSKVTSAATLTSLGVDANTVITIKGSDVSKEQKLVVDSSTTINDFIGSLQKAGLNANYDLQQGRIFISSSKSGVEQGFSITTTAVAEDYVTAANKLKEVTNYSALSKTEKDALDGALSVLKTAEAGSQEYTDAVSTIQEFADKNAKSTYETAYNNGLAEVRNEDFTARVQQKANQVLTAEGSDYENQTAWLASDEGKAWFDEHELATEEEVQAAYSAAYKVAEQRTIGEINSDEKYNDFRNEVNSSLDAKYGEAITTEDLQLVREKAGLAGSLEETLADAATKVTENISAYVANSAEIEANNTGEGNSLLTKIGLAEITGEAIAVGGAGNVSGLTVVAAKNAKFTLDGASMEEESNSFTVNNMTFTLKGATAGDGMTFTVSEDNDATYNMVKGFVKEFNDVLKAMNDLYYADKAKGYEPLTDEEKEAMSEDQIEKWETKIKDSLLRRDSTLGMLITAVKSAVMGQVSVDGKTASLASFGIMTSVDYTERGLLHIMGDADDSLYSSDPNELKKMLEEDPEVTMKALAQISKNLYDTMTEKMASSSISSAMKFYNDKIMTSADTDYKKQIKQWETKLSDLEGRYYKQFTAMETALSKLQNQSNSLASLLGTSS